MSIGEMVILGGLAALLIIGTKGTNAAPQSDAKKAAAPPPPRPSAMRWMSRGG
jgi:hypothetical protein